jgi:hypothetical protein
VDIGRGKAHSFPKESEVVENLSILPSEGYLLRSIVIVKVNIGTARGFVGADEACQKREDDERFQENECIYDK